MDFSTRPSTVRVCQFRHPDMRILILNNNNLIKFSCQIADNINMYKFSKKKGLALFEYFIIAAFFALALALTVFQNSPDILRKYFEKSIDNNATTTGGTLTMKVMGE